MSTIKESNCYSIQEKSNVETRFFKTMTLWSEKWFVSADLSLNWHWNTTLFGCASEIDVNKKQIGEGWPKAASHSLFGNKNNVIESTYIEQIQLAMQNDLCAMYHYSEGQLAAIVEVTIDETYTLLIELPLSYIVKKNNNHSKKSISTVLLETISEQQTVHLSSEIKSCQVPLTQVLNLQVGDLIPLEHNCATPINIDMGKIPLVRGFLVSKQGQRAVVLTQA